MHQNTTAHTIEHATKVILPFNYMATANALETANESSSKTSAAQQVALRGGSQDCTNTLTGYPEMRTPGYRISVTTVPQTDQGRCSSVLVP